ncbi:Hint domain-containing protein [Roseovarius nanhaiticus]|uniref:Hint domain-containing protein n=1 Tax=Roseovarius nanhaiticus TaxID=573024 RepID=UPI0024937D29|nr:Hint domain-containing protein [Roseovarius nanhaiticus]
MPTVTLILRGDQIGRYTSFSGTGNGPDRVVTVNGVEAVGTADQLYTVTVEQVNSGVTEFENGQFITILDADGNVVVPRTGVQPDIEQGRGAGDEHLLLSNQPFLIDLGGVPVGPATVTYTEADESSSAGGDDDGQLDFEDFPCIAPGAMIATPTGSTEIAALKTGDLVETQDHGAVPLAWVGRRSLDLTNHASGKPILIKAASFGNQRPRRDLVLSPDHRVLVDDPACVWLFGTSEVLAPSKGLASLPRIREMRGRQHIEYVTLFTERHEIIFADGLAVETLYPGPQALRRLGALGRAAILSTCPALRHQSASVVYPSARRLLSVRESEAVSEALRLKSRVETADGNLKPSVKLRVLK